MINILINHFLKATFFPLDK